MFESEEIYAIAMIDDMIDAQVAFGASTSTGGGDGVELERKFYYNTISLIFYCGFAEKGTNANQPFWTITTIQTNMQGQVITSIKRYNQKWSEII